MICPIESREETELVAYSTGKMDARRTAALEVHVAICSGCREFVAAQQVVWRALDAWEPLAVTIDFDRRLYERLQREVTWRDRLLRGLRRLLLHRALPLAAAASVVVTAGLVLQRAASVPPQGPAQLEIVQTDQVVHALDDMEMLREFTSAVRSDNGEL